MGRVLHGSRAVQGYISYMSQPMQLSLHSDSFWLGGEAGKGTYPPGIRKKKLLSELGV